MANHCESLNPWAFLPDPFAQHAPTSRPQAGSWLSPHAAAFENEAVASALRASLSSSSSPTPSNSTASSASEPARPPKPASASASGPGPAQTGPTGRIAKRKPRASRRAPTTYINADPANFPRMVQEITGAPVPGGGKPRFTPASAARPAPALACVLPTLDTSAFLIERAQAPEKDEGSSATAGDPAAVAGVEESLLFELEEMVRAPAMSGFPTLESWGMI